MAISFIGSVSTGAGTVATAQMVIPPGALTGDIFLVGIYREATSTITPPAGKGYVTADPQDVNGANFWLDWFMADLLTADANQTHSFAFTSCWRQACGVVLRGAAAIASQLDTNAPAATKNTSPQTTGATPADTAATAGDLAVWFAGTFSSVTITEPATNDGNTVTERFDDGNNFHCVSAPYPSSGTVSAMTITHSGSTEWMHKTFLVKVAGAAAQDTPELYGRPDGLSGQRQLHQLLAQ